MIIAIDYDGTIGDTNREKVKWIAENLGETVAPWHCNRTDCVPIIGLEPYERMGNHVYERESTLQANEVPGALAALRALSGKAALHVVTARTEARVPHAREWLASQGVLSLIAGTHSSAGSSKSAVCSAIGASILIDDDIRHLRQVELAGLHRILLQAGRDDVPACGSEVAFCRSWQGVLERVAAMG